MKDVLVSLMSMRKDKTVEQSDIEANALYKKAAIQGHFQAQFNLGARYASGRGVEVDLATAHFWFERSKLGASALNTERANKAIEAISEHMTESEMNEAKLKFNQLLTSTSDLP